MSLRPLVWLIVLAGIGLPCVAAGQTAASEPPRTPWGDPDLQGFWNNNSAAPLERPENLGERATLTAEEVEQRFERRRNLLFGRREGDTGSYNEFWFEHGQDNNRASLIVDPPDGRMPLTPDARNRISGRASAACSRRMRRTGQPPGPQPVGPMHHPQHAGRHDPELVQREHTRSCRRPGYVALLVEMIHDVRDHPAGRPVAPAAGRPPVAGQLARPLGRRHAGGRNDPLHGEGQAAGNRPHGLRGRAPTCA